MGFRVGAVCDWCGLMLFLDGETSLAAWTIALEQGWQDVAGDLLCPACQRKEKSDGR